MNWIAGNQKPEKGEGINNREKIDNKREERINNKKKEGNQ
jgi:hypothetical protein